MVGVFAAADKQRGADTGTRDVDAMAHRAGRAPRSARARACVAEPSRAAARSVTSPVGRAAAVPAEPSDAAGTAAAAAPEAIAPAPALRVNGIQSAVREAARHKSLAELSNESLGVRPVDGPAGLADAGR